MRSSGGFLLLRGQGAFLELGAGLVQGLAFFGAQGNAAAAVDPLIGFAVFSIVLDKMNAVGAGFVRHGYHLKDILHLIKCKVNTSN